MLKKYSKFIILLSIFCFLFSVSSNICFAGIVPEPSGGGEGDYTLNDFVKLMINVANFILSIVGSLALLAFVLGGVMFLISAGSAEKIAQAKKILIGAVIGIVIVFTSYTIISFILEKSGFDPGKTNWNTGPYNWVTGRLESPSESSE